MRFGDLRPRCAMRTLHSDDVEEREASPSFHTGANGLAGKP
jgi:hypothetical protein